VLWRGLAEIAEKYIRKGSQIYVEGKITTRKWEKDGITRYTTEIQADNIELLGRRPEGGVSSETSHSSNTTHSTAATSTAATSGTSENEGGSDDLPF
jgi:single-strand DNA-binding protein